MEKIKFVLDKKKLSKAKKFVFFMKWMGNEFLAKYRQIFLFRTKKKLLNTRVQVEGLCMRQNESCPTPIFFSCLVHLPGPLS